MTLADVLRERLVEAERAGQAGRAREIKLLLERERQADGLLEVWEDQDAWTEIRHKVRDAGDFKPNSFRRKKIAGGVTFVMGKLQRPPEGKAGSMVVQSMRFSKATFTMAQAKAWAAAHKETIDEFAGQAIAERIMGGMDGSYEDTMRRVSAAVEMSALKFGLQPDGDGELHSWHITCEATFGDYAIVSNSQTAQLFKVTWSANDQGEVELGEPQEVVVDYKPASETVAQAVDRNFPGADARRLTEAVQSPVRILEEVDEKVGKRTMTVECLLGVADRPTANGRVYPRSLFEHLVALEKSGAAEAKRWMGEADHPPDGRPRLSETVTTPWRSLRLDEGSRLHGTTDIIPTSRGRDLMEQIRAGVPVQVSSRAFGKERAETRDGKSVNVVQVEGLDWGGWDMVLGAACPEAGVTRVLEASRERGRDEAEDIDMTPKELAELVREQVNTEIKPLLEAQGGAAPPGGDKPSDKPAEKTDAGPQPNPIEAKLDAIAAQMTQIGEKTDKLEAKGATDQERAAKLQLIEGWRGPAKQVMAESLRQAETPAQLGEIFERQKKVLESAGLLIVDAPAGTATAVTPGERTSKYTEDRAKRFQLGLLEQRHRPASVGEAIDLFAEGLKDNGLRYYRENADPEDPMAAWARENQPWRGYHPGNPKHAFMAVLQNTIAQHPEYIAPHLRTGPARLEWTANADVQTGAPFMFPLLRQVWERLEFLMDLMSVQAMNRSTGNVYYLDFVTDPAGADPTTPDAVVSDYAQYVSEQHAVAEMKATMATGPVTMDTKKLGAEWSTEVQQDMRANWGLELASELLGAMGSEIAREVALLLLNAMRLNADLRGRPATVGNQNFGLALPAVAVFGTGTLIDWRKELFLYIVNGDSLVRAQSHRSTNFAICGTTASVYLHGQENFKSWSGADAQRSDIGIERVGSLEGAPAWAVYVCDSFPTNLILLGRKGAEWYDAGMIYAPYIPLYITPQHVDPRTFCNRIAMMSRFGFAKTDGRLFTTITLNAGVAGVPL